MSDDVMKPTPALDRVLDDSVAGWTLPSNGDRSQARAELRALVTALQQERETSESRKRMLAALADEIGQKDTALASCQKELNDVREVLAFAVRTGALRESDAETFTVAGQVNRLHSEVLQCRPESALREGLLRESLAACQQALREIVDATVDEDADAFETMTRINHIAGDALLPASRPAGGAPDYTPTTFTEDI